MNRTLLACLVAAAALPGCVSNSDELTLKDGVRGCATLDDARRFEKIEQAHDWNASMDMLRSGRCAFVAPGDAVVIEKTALDGSTRFHERGRERSLWTKEAIRPLARKG